MSEIQSQIEGGPGTTLDLSPNVAFVRTTLVPAEPAPTGTTGPIGWLRSNLFSGPVNIIQTILAIVIAYFAGRSILEFGLFDAVWSGTSREACATVAQGGVIADQEWSGACWPYVSSYLKQFIYGTYPIAERWRVNVAAILLALALIPLLVQSFPYKKLGFLYAGVIFPVAAFILLTGGELELNGFLLPSSLMGEGHGKFWVDYAVFSAIVLGIVVAIGRATKSTSNLTTVAAILLGIAAVLLFCSLDFGLRHVRTELWGGMLVTLVIAVTGIAVSLPLGILLALGRRSTMPLVKLLCVIFIEFWRGVPLVTVLFMSSVMLPLFASEGVDVDKLVRALIGVALFASAYMAEVVRGGLQAIPKGQYEGAAAVGLTFWQSMRLIILPQALTLVIPGIVNTFIGLFKDTTLVLIIGLFDFLGQIQASFSDPTWATPVQSSTAYLFAAICYFIFCFGMSRYSIYMENRLDTGHKS